MAHGNNTHHGGGTQRKRHGAEGKSRRSNQGKRRRHGGDGAQEAASASASAAFLAALEAQRAKQAAEDAPQQQAQQETQPATVAATPPADGRPSGRGPPVRAALPGYFYDEAKGRYFKLTKQHQQLRQQQQRRSEAATVMETFEQERRALQLAAGTGRAVRRRGWMAFLAERQLLAGSAVQHRDRRELMPRFVASRLKCQALSRVEVAINPGQDRFSAMDISPDSSSVFLGYATGHVRAFANQAEPRGTSRSLVELGVVDTIGMTVSCIRHHQRESGILISAVGATVSETLTPLMVRSTSETRGRIGLFSDSTFRQQPHVWEMNDPWVVEWCPQQTNLFSVGLGGHKGAALVDCSAFRDGQVAMEAPSGRIKSDTLSQTFSHQTPVIIVNGCRNGSWWMWDTRAPRRATEVTNHKDKSPGSIQSMRLLRDERRLVTQLSNGELAVVDLRSARHSHVTAFCRGERDAYRSMLRFDLDENETIVACAASSSVAVFDLSRGTQLSELGMSHHSSNTYQPASTTCQVETIVFRENEAEPSLWALGKTALYRNKTIAR